MTRAGRKKPVSMLFCMLLAVVSNVLEQRWGKINFIARKYSQHD